MQPFMKNVAVEYAAKALPDGELAQALDTLQQAIDGKIGFDGVIDITPSGSNYRFIMPEQGIYLIRKSSPIRTSGIAIVRPAGPDGNYTAAYYDIEFGKFYYPSPFAYALPGSTFEVSEKVSGTQLYKHATTLTYGGGSTLTFYTISNRPDSYNITALKNYGYYIFDSLLYNQRYPGDTVFMQNGPVTVIYGDTGYLFTINRNQFSTVKYFMFSSRESAYLSFYDADTITDGAIVKGSQVAEIAITGITDTVTPL